MLGKRNHLGLHGAPMMVRELDLLWARREHSALAQKLMLN